MSGMNNAKNDDGMGRMRVPSVNAAQRHGLAPKDRAMVGIQSSGVMPASQSMVRVSMGLVAACTASERVPQQRGV